MPHRLITHLRSNVVAYIALIISVISGGGGYAIAATTAHHKTTKRHRTTIVACASRRTGELFLHRHGRCGRGKHKVRWNIKGPRGKTGAAGAPAPSIFAAVDPGVVADGVQPTPEKGMTIQRTGTGTFVMTITDPVCSQGANVPVLTPTADYFTGDATPPAGATPVAYIAQQNSPTQFTLQTGYTAAGAFTADDLHFYVQDTCLPPTSAAQSRR